MSYLMVKLKGEEDYKKILSLDESTSLFPPYDRTHIREYDPKYILEEEECFKINRFSEKSFSIDIVKREFTDVEYNMLTEIKESKVEFIFWVDETNYYFQRVTPSQIVERKIISLRRNQLVEDGPNLVIKNEADC